MASRRKHSSVHIVHTVSSFHTQCLCVVRNTKVNRLLIVHTQSAAVGHAALSYVLSTQQHRRGRVSTQWILSEFSLVLKLGFLVTFPFEWVARRLVWCLLLQWYSFLRRWAHFVARGITAVSNIVNFDCTAHNISSYVPAIEYRVSWSFAIWPSFQLATTAVCAMCAHSTFESKIANRYLFCPSCVQHKWKRWRWSQTESIIWMYMCSRRTSSSSLSSSSLRKPVIHTAPRCALLSVVRVEKVCLPFSYISYRRLILIT